MDRKRNMTYTIMLRLTCCVAAVIPLAACVSEMTVYESDDTEIGLKAVSGMTTKGLPGAMEGPDYNRYETFGVFAWHKLTGAPQSWTDFIKAENAGNLVTYIDNKPFARLGTWYVGGYNTLDISIERNTVDGEKGKNYVMEISDVRNTHEPYYWPKSGYLAFAGYSPYYRFEIVEEEYEDEGGEMKTRLAYHSSRTRLDSGDTDVEYTADAEHPYLSITGFTQGRFEWEHNNHWATNETCDLMWFDADENHTGNLGLSGNGKESVDVQFHHACAWLDFNLRAEDEKADRKFVILKAVLENICWKGDFRSDDGTGNAVWTNPGDLRDIILYYNMAKDGEDKETMFNAITYEDYFRIDKMMVIPQLLEKENADVSLTIYYKQLTSDTGYRPVDNYGENDNPDDYLYTGSPLTEKTTITLTADNGKWEMGKHYIYDVIFGLDRIKIVPATEEWPTQTGTVTAN